MDLVTFFLGESYHPGGVELTRRLADALALEPEESVLDVACGIGTTSLLLAAERAVRVLGVDLGEAQVVRARAHAHKAGLGEQVRFEVGDAERLPVEAGSFDAAVCECAFCTFTDKATAAAELSRVLRPGGRVGITDVWLDPTSLDDELAGLAGRVACLADALPIHELRAVLEGAACASSTSSAMIMSWPRPSDGSRPACGPYASSTYPSCDRSICAAASRWPAAPPTSSPMGTPATYFSSPPSEIRGLSRDRAVRACRPR